MEKKHRTPEEGNLARVRAYRARKAEEGIAELRGVMLPKELHEQAKQVLASWLKRIG